MVLILQKYKILFITALGIIIAALALSFTIKAKSNKIPSRGVFVLGQTNTNLV